MITLRGLFQNPLFTLIYVLVYTQEQVKGQFGGVGPLLPLCGILGSNSDVEPDSTFVH